MPDLPGRRHGGGRSRRSEAHRDGPTGGPQTGRGGDADAQALLGALLELGTGVMKDEKTAAQWYLKAADKGDLVATHNLGTMYEDGRGVAKDEKKAANEYGVEATPSRCCSGRLHEGGLCACER